MPVKRFIAGATCPACGAVDRIYVLFEGDTALSRHCVDCTFEEHEMPSPEGAATVEVWSPVRISGPGEVESD